MLTTLRFLTCLTWAAAATGLTWYVLHVARQMTYVTLADGRRQARALPLSFRLLLPFAANLRPLTGRPALEDARVRVERRLVAAGFEGLVSGEEFLALRILHPVVLGTGWILLLAGLARLDPTVRDNAVWLGILGVLLWYFKPAVWLRHTLQMRHRSIQRALPFVLDLLTLSVEAGMDFMSALQRSVERRTLDPLSEELIRMTHEIQLGTPRRVALRNLARRVDLAELRSVSYALIQADELGVSIGAILRIQSDQMRQRRFDRAERLANEAPVKLLGPLMLFIFPAVFIVLLGPILARVMGQLI